MKTDLDTLSRRTLLVGSLGTLALSLTPVAGFDLSESMKQAILKQYGKIPEIDNSRVKIDVPTINENGNSVPVTINVDSPMNPDNYVKRISLFSERNPIPRIADFMLGPSSGIARVSTRVRLAGSQTLMVITESNSGELMAGSADTIVTLAACIVM